jgi:tRNA threonylcarbamoyladenosine biosynthesis protein TsaE
MSAVQPLISDSPEATERLAQEFAARLKPGDWIGLIGPLGAGKSVWARGLARGLGVAAHVVSPTFTLVNVYPGRIRFCHVDLYRVRSAAELIDFGFETFDDGNTVIAVEWADYLPEAELPYTWNVIIKRTGETQRSVIVREMPAVAMKDGR